MPEIDTKLMRAAIAVLEAGTFSKAAIRLRIGQSGLTKQINALEDELGFDIFSREGKTVVATTAGEIFIAEARLSLEHHERAIRLSRSAKEQSEVVIHFGKSPYTDPYLVTQLFSLRLPLIPTMKVLLTSKLASELVQDLLNGSLDLAFVTGVPETQRLTSVLVSDQSFFAAMRDDDPLTQQRQIGPDDLKSSSCILFERHVHPYLYEELLRFTRPASTRGCAIHHVMTAEDAAHFVHRGLGVAILTQAGAWRICKKEITIRPLIVEGLRVQTRLTCRSDNQDRTVRDFVRTFVKMLHSSSENRQLDLRLAG